MYFWSFQKRKGSISRQDRVNILSFHWIPSHLERLHGTNLWTANAVDELRKETRIQSSTKVAMGFLLCSVFFPSWIQRQLKIRKHSIVQTEALQEKSYSSQRSKKENSQGSERVGKNPFLKSSFHSFSPDTSGKPTVPGRVPAAAAGQAYKLVRKRALITGPVVPRVQDESQSFFLSRALSLCRFTTWCLVKDIIIGYAWQHREN